MTHSQLTGALCPVDSGNRSSLSRLPLEVSSILQSEPPPKQSVFVVLPSGLLHCSYPAHSGGNPPPPHRIPTHPQSSFSSYLDNDNQRASDKTNPPAGSHMPDFSKMEKR